MSSTREMNEADRTTGRFANAMEEPCDMSDIVRDAVSADYWLE